MMATAAPRPIPATSSGFAHATNARRNRVVIENDDGMVLRLQDTAKGVTNILYFLLPAGAATPRRAHECEPEWLHSVLYTERG